MRNIICILGVLLLCGCVVTHSKCDRRSDFDSYEKFITDKEKRNDFISCGAVFDGYDNFSYSRIYKNIKERIKGEKIYTFEYTKKVHNCLIRKGYEYKPSDKGV